LPWRCPLGGSGPSRSSVSPCSSSGSPTVSVVGVERSQGSPSGPPGCTWGWRGCGSSRCPATSSRLRSSLRCTLRRRRWHRPGRGRRSAGLPRTPSPRSSGWRSRSAVCRSRRSGSRKRVGRCSGPPESEGVTVLTWIVFQVGVTVAIAVRAAIERDRTTRRDPVTGRPGWVPAVIVVGVRRPGRGGTPWSRRRRRAHDRRGAGGRRAGHERARRAVAGRDRAAPRSNGDDRALRRPRPRGVARERHRRERPAVRRQPGRRGGRRRGGSAGRPLRGRRDGRLRVLRPSRARQLRERAGGRDSRR
jgi:hypothetical protein